CLLAGEVLVAKVDQHEVVVCTVADEVVTFGDECLRHCLCVGDDLLSVAGEFIGENFTESNCLGGDDVFKRTALCAGEDGEVEQLAHHSCLAFRIFDAPGIFEIMTKHDDATSWSTKRLVRGRGDDMTM